MQYNEYMRLLPEYRRSWQGQRYGERYAEIYLRDFDEFISSSLRDTKDAQGGRPSGTVF